MHKSLSMLSSMCQLLYFHSLGTNDSWIWPWPNIHATIL